jgi:XTP/dITP diphosphohydrolase
MKPLLVATQNKGKIKEIKSVLQSHFQIEVPQYLEVIEDGKTYKENVTKKARAYFEAYKIPVLADDSGLEVAHLNNLPGVDSAYYGGENLEWQKKLELLISELKAFKKPWLAKFVCLLCYYDGKKFSYFEGSCLGEITSEIKGAQGFGFDPVFYSYDLKKTFGVASEDEKNQCSHRANALKAFLTTQIQASSL